MSIRRWRSLRGDEEADYRGVQAIQQMQQTEQAPGRSVQTARQSLGGNAPRKMVSPKRRVTVQLVEDGIDSEEDEDEDEGKPKNLMEFEQSLLHFLSTEILVNSRTRGQLSCFHAEFDR